MRKATRTNGKIKMLMRQVVGFVFGAGLIAIGSPEANAQGHNQRYAQNVHSSGHSVYSGGHSVYAGGHRVYAGGHNVYAGGHRVYSGGHHVYASGHRVYAGGHHVYAGGHRVYAGGHSGGHNVYTGGHYADGRYSRPHHDSHNPVVRFIHHALGGH